MALLHVVRRAIPMPSSAAKFSSSLRCNGFGKRWMTSSSASSVSATKAATGQFYPYAAAAGLGSIALGFALSSAQSSQTDNQAHMDAPPTSLSMKQFREFKLKESQQLTHNTKLLRFELPSAEHIIGLQVASCLTIAADGIGKDGKMVARPYTPCSRPDTKGVVDFVIKEYPAPNGIMSRHLCSLKPGDVVKMKGPWKKLKYEAGMKKKIGMIAGGTGITPMLQIIQAILDNPADTTEVSLLFANVTEEDIMLRDRLDGLASVHSNFKVSYTLDKPASGWKGHTGFVNAAMVAKELPEPDEDHMILVCGPNPMLNHVAGKKKYVKGRPPMQGEIGGVLKSMGYTKDMVYKF